MPNTATKPRFHVMVKPSGAQCNLDCSYCFYLHKQPMFGQPEMPRMPDTVLEAHVRQYIAAQEGTVVFSWQGGEPTLMGLDFFRRVVALQAQYSRPGQAIENDLQTNGVLLNAEWAAFLKQHNFLVGLSCDGPPELHDRYRRAKGGSPTAARVERAAELLRAHSVPFHALCVVNRSNARRPIDVYRYLRDTLRPRMIQFIPCVERRQHKTRAPGHWSAEETQGAPAELVTDWSLLPEDWGYFLDRIWQEWFKRDYGTVFIDQFENVISMLFGYGAQKCLTSERCGRALALEHNGDLFSCDHFVYPEYRLGNILDSEEGALLHGARQQDFGRTKSASLPDYCRRCDDLTLCWGDCPKNRFTHTPDGQPGLSYLCAGLRRFYATTRLHRRELVQRLGTGHDSY